MANTETIIGLGDIKNSWATARVALTNFAGTSSPTETTFVEKHANHVTKILLLHDLHTQGAMLEGTLARKLSFPNVASLVENPDFISRLVATRLDLVMIPGLSVTDADLQNIEEQKPTSLANLLPRDYLEGVANGSYPFTIEPYILLADSVLTGRITTTPLTEALKLGNPNNTSMAQALTASRTNGGFFVAELGLESTQAHIQPLSVIERAVIYTAHRQAPHEVGTRTQPRGSSGKHVVFDGRTFSQHDIHAKEPSLQLGVRLGPSRERHVPIRS